MRSAAASKFGGAALAALCGVLLAMPSMAQTGNETEPEVGTENTPCDFNQQWYAASVEPATECHAATSTCFNDLESSSSVSSEEEYMIAVICGCQQDFLECLRGEEMCSAGVVGTEDHDRYYDQLCVKEAERKAAAVAGDAVAVTSAVAVGIASAGQMAASAVGGASGGAAGGAGASLGALIFIGVMQHIAKMSMAVGANAPAFYQGFTESFSFSMGAINLGPLADLAGEVRGSLGLGERDAALADGVTDIGIIVDAANMATASSARGMGVPPSDVLVYEILLTMLIHGVLTSVQLLFLYLEAHGHRLAADGRGHKVDLLVRRIRWQVWHLMLPMNTIAAVAQMNHTASAGLWLLGAMWFGLHCGYIAWRLVKALSLAMRPYWDRLPYKLSPTGKVRWIATIVSWLVLAALAVRAAMQEYYSRHQEWQARRAAELEGRQPKQASAEVDADGPATKTDPDAVDATTGTSSPKDKRPVSDSESKASDDVSDAGDKPSDTRPAASTGQGAEDSKEDGGGDHAASVDEKKALEGVAKGEAVADDEVPKAGCCGCCRRSVPVAVAASSERPRATELEDVDEEVRGPMGGLINDMDVALAYVFFLEIGHIFFEALVIGLLKGEPGLEVTLLWLGQSTMCWIYARWRPFYDNFKNELIIRIAAMEAASYFLLYFLLPTVDEGFARVVAGLLLAIDAVTVVLFMCLYVFVTVQLIKAKWGQLVQWWRERKERRAREKQAAADAKADGAESTDPEAGVAAASPKGAEEGDGETKPSADGAAEATGHTGEAGRETDRSDKSVNKLLEEFENGGADSNASLPGQVPPSSQRDAGGGKAAKGGSTERSDDLDVDALLDEMETGR